MPKANKPGSQTQSQTQAQQKADQKAPEGKEEKKAKGSKNQQRRVGGSAVEGAKSTQPREIKTSDPQRQQFESYNREMRRRMQHLKTGPYSETPTLVEQRKKRIEKRKRKLEETKATARQLRARGPRTISLGKRNTYFLIGVAVLLVAICVIAILLHFGVL